MNIRQTLNEKPRVAAAVVGAMCLLALGLLLWEHGGRGAGAANLQGKVFFSDDDGKTWFIGDPWQFPPFDHNGNQAVGASVYRCGTGKPFVVYLQKYSDKQLATIARERQDFDAYQAAHPMPTPPPFYASISPGLAKKPGDAKWISATLPNGKDNPAYAKLMKPRCPDKSYAIPVGAAEADALP